MENNKSFSEKVYDVLIKWPLFAIAIFLPIFFLPWTTNVLDFNKQALLLILVSISLFAWVSKSFFSGTTKMSFNPFLVFVLLFAFVYSASSFFSMYRYGSIWGMSDSASRGLITVVALSVFYFLTTSLFQRKDIFKMLCLFSASSVLALLFGVLQLAGRFIFTFPFSQSANFNTIGSVNSLSIFAAVLFPLAVSLAYLTKRVLKWILVALIILIAAILLLVNFKFAWLAIAVGAALFIVLSMQKRDLIGGNKSIIPMFFLSVALILIFFNFQIPVLSSRSIEVYLNQKTSLGIAINTLKEKPILGSGPSTFSYDFSKFKNTDFNNTLFWNARFENAGSKVTSILAETGVLGTVVFLLMAGAFLFYGLLFSLGLKKQAVLENPSDASFKILEIGIFISFVTLIVSSFFYSMNLTTDFYFFLLMAGMSVFFYPEKKEVILKTSSIATLILTFILMVIFIVNLGILISGAQRYIAEVYYFSALKEQADGNTDLALADAERAVMINQKLDVLARDLSQIYLAKLNTEIKRQDIPVAQLRQNVSKLMQLATAAAQRATNLNPADPANWSVKGYIYQNMISLYIGFDEEAIKAFDEAIKLEPANPYYVTQEGIVLLAVSSQLAEDQKTDKQKKMEDAEVKFKRAIELKPDYALAMFQLAIIYQAQGKTNEAIAQLQKAEAAAPSDAGLPFQLGLVYYGNEKYNDARIEFEKAVNINAQYSNALYFLGLVYDKLGNRNKAIEMIDKVSSLNPENEEVKKVFENLKAGRGALDGLSSQESAAPISETPSEIKETPSPAKDSAK